jgi:hypothetical protein
MLWRMNYLQMSIVKGEVTMSCFMVSDDATNTLLTACTRALRTTNLKNQKKTLFS